LASKFRAKRGHCRVQAGFHRPTRATDSARDFIYLEICPEAQNDHDAVLWREFLKGATDIIANCIVLEWIDARQLFRRVHRNKPDDSSSTRSIETYVHENAIEPSLKQASVAECAAGLPGAG
jgi:hypothetical protein